jgi:hypothetical protein
MPVTARTDAARDDIFPVVDAALDAVHGRPGTDAERTLMTDAMSVATKLEVTGNRSLALYLFRLIAADAAAPASAANVAASA